MKKIFLTLLCIVSVAFNWSQINAENESECNNSVINITIREKPDSNIKPHDETISVVSWYHNDTINFSFESYEGNAWFSITNINTGQKYTCSYSTLQHPKCKHYLGESRETLAMQFDFLTEIARIEAGTYRGEYVAPFTKEIAYGCKTKFGCNSSSATLKDAYNYLKWQGYNCSYANGEIDDNGLINNLKKGYPHIIGGISNDNEFAHAWIIDGYSSKYRPISSRNQRLILEVLYHCNWGWDGNCDGWYACDDYPSSSSDPRNRTYISKKEHIYIYGF